MLELGGAITLGAPQVLVVMAHLPIRAVAGIRGVSSAVVSWAGWAVGWWVGTNRVQRDWTADGPVTRNIPEVEEEDDNDEE